MTSPELVKLAIEAFQRQEYPNDKDWFFDVQTVDQLIEALEFMADYGEVIEGVEVDA